MREVEDPDLSGLPYWYICKLRDIIDQINIQLDICKNDLYKSEFRMIQKGLKEFVDYYDDIYHGDILKENMK